MREPPGIAGARQTRELRTDPAPGPGVPAAVWVGGSMDMDPDHADRYGWDARAAYTIEIAVDGWASRHSGVRMRRIPGGWRIVLDRSTLHSTWRVPR